MSIVHCICTNAKQKYLFLCWPFPPEIRDRTRQLIHSKIGWILRLSARNTNIFTRWCCSWYWQSAMDKDDLGETKFVTHRELFKYRRMLFELKSAAVTSQRATNDIHASVNWQDALVYIHDIIIVSKTLETHLKQLGEVLRLLLKADATIRQKNVLSTVIVFSVYSTWLHRKSCKKRVRQQKP